MRTTSILAPIIATIITLIIIRHHHNHPHHKAHYYCLKCGAQEHTTGTTRQNTINQIHNAALNHSIEHRYGYTQPRTTPDHPPTILIKGPGFNTLPHPYEHDTEEKL